MATLYKKRNYWYIDYIVDGKRFSKNTYLTATKSNKNEAKKIKSEIENVISSKNFIVPTGGTLSAYVDMFREEHLNLKSKSHQNVFRDALGNFLKIVPLNTRIEEIKSEHIAKYIHYLGERVENSTLLTYLNYMKIFFNFLVEEEIIPRNPIRKKQIPKRIKKNIVPFKKDMLDDILTEAHNRDPEYYKFLMMLLLTGQRPIDVLDLRAGDVDIDNMIVRIRISKTDKEIIFPLYDALSDFVESQLQKIKQLTAEERIFQAFNSDIVHKRFMRIKRFLKIKGRHVYTLKTFRKTFASYLASRGLDNTKIADLLGHDNVETTRKYYAAVSAENLRNELNKIYEGERPGKSADKSADKT